MKSPPDKIVRGALFLHRQSPIPPGLHRRDSHDSTSFRRSPKGIRSVENDENISQPYHLANEERVRLGDPLSDLYLKNLYNLVPS